MTELNKEAQLQGEAGKTIELTAHIGTVILSQSSGHQNPKIRTSQTGVEDLAISVYEANLRIHRSKKRMGLRHMVNLDISFRIWTA